MKRFLLAFAFIGYLMTASAQRFTPLDPSASSLSFKSFFINPVHLDSITPNAFESFYATDTIRHADTLTIRTTNAKKWDRFSLELQGDSLTAGRIVTFKTTDANKVILVTTITANNITVKKRKKAIIVFRFDGVAWVEEIRSIQF